MRTLSLVCALSCASPAFAAEEVITFEVDGLRVVGTLSLPDTDTLPPAVLMLPGFSGSRQGAPLPGTNETSFARAARVWAEQGIASLRIDYRYNGESEGDFADSTMQAHLQDSLVALDWLVQSGRVDANRLGVMGISMGAILSAGVGARSEHEVRSMVMWSPGTNFFASLGLLVGFDVMRAGLAAADGETVAVDLPWRTGLMLRRPFFESLIAVDPLAEIVSYDGPLLVVVGTNDTAVYPQPLLGQMLLDYHSGEHELVVGSWDHLINAFVDAASVDEVIALTGQYLADTLSE